jgi:hypothetical protein
MLTSIICRDVPTTKLPKSQLPATCPECHGFGMGLTCGPCGGTGVELPRDTYAEADLLAADLRTIALRVEKLGLPEAAAVLLEISAAVEIEAARPFTPAPDDMPF